MPILLAIGSNNKYTLCYWLNIIIQFIFSYTSLINDNLYNTVQLKCSHVLCSITKAIAMYDLSTVSFLFWF
jgi:hypothetical protein